MELMSRLAPTASPSTRIAGLPHQELQRALELQMAFFVRASFSLSFRARQAHRRPQKIWRAGLSAAATLGEGEGGGGG